VTPKPVRLTVAARRDVGGILAHYRREAGVPIADAFVDALQQALGFLAQNPAAGSLRYAYQTGIPGLRIWPIRRYPHLVLYLDGEHVLEVVRVLHGKRDIPASLRGSVKQA
jgi:toxin ParE1/3/4